MNRKYMIIAIIAIVIIIAALFTFSNSSPGSGVSINTNALEERGVLNVEGTSQEASDGYYKTGESDTNTILVNNSGILKIKNSIVNKTGDTQTSGDDADFYGVNSAILVKDSSTLTIENVEIVTDSEGSNGIFVTNTNTNQGGDPQGGGTPPDGGEPPAGGAPPDDMKKTDKESNGTKAVIKNVKITTYKDKSRGLDATFGGIIEAENVEINTNGNSCAAIATDRGEGNITVKNSNINTGVDQKSGRGSPLIY